MARIAKHLTRYSFHLVFHTHWDREWYLPRASLTARLVPVVDQLVEALEQDAAFRSFFLDGQTVLLEDYLRIRSEQAARVRALVAEGRIATGPWYVLADELIPSAESLVRNLLIGAAGARRMGRRHDVLYSPDAFGHPAAWPALAAQFGIRFGVLWRGLAPERDDVDLFRWAAADGSEVLLYHLPRDGYEIGAALPANLESLREAWPAVREVLVSRAGTSHVAVFVGADHHAAHEAPAALRELIAELEPGHEVRISSLEEFFSAVEEARPEVRRIRGELRASYGYTWTLQGVHGTRLPLKRLNSRVELLLERWAEPLAALAAGQGGRDRRPLLLEAWRSVVQSHFHDALAGCSHDRVAVETHGRLGDAAVIAREIVRASLDELSGHDPDAARSSRDSSSLLVWNPAVRTRSGVVVADATFFRRDILVGPPGARLARSGKGFQPFALRTGSGSMIPVQVIEERRALERRDAWRHYPDMDEVDAVRIAFELPAMAGMSFAHLAPVKSGMPGTPVGKVVAAGRRLSNGVLEVDLAADGTVALRDLRTGSRLTRLLTIESEPDRGDTYSFAPGSGEVTTARARASSRMVAAGPFVGILEARWQDLDAAFRLHVELRSGEPIVRLSLEIDNRGTDRRLRARFPLGLRNLPSIAGAAFGAELRPAGAPGLQAPAEASVPTAPAHRYVAAAGPAAGLALLVPGHCEYEWQADGDLLLTLLRSTGQLSRNDLPTRPGHAGWPVATPEAQCLGRDRVTLALVPVLSAGATPGQLHELWESAFLPLSARWIRDAGPLRAPPVSLELEGRELILSAVKPAEDGAGIVLRCWNASEESVDGAWRVAPPPERAWLTRADEEGGEELEIGQDGVIPFTAGPRGIVTVRIAFSGRPAAR
ncbi:MAG TPA: glycoside hydrolase family 38 C-terminal domain-containing protein [Gemmatimonadales bacterium]|nr:glycoside hydrolase family 38 C-terminal domain-containing protein [Gemmatimonadales bacterium]